MGKVVNVGITVDNNGRYGVTAKASGQLDNFGKALVANLKAEITYHPGDKVLQVSIPVE